MSRFDELLAKELEMQVRKAPSDEEHRLQVGCVRWFCLQYPQMAHSLFAVPNGGRRDERTGAKLKAEGVQAGVSDLILLRRSRDYGALCIEMKTPTGAQSKVQKAWQRQVTADGYKYVVCRSVEDFMREVNAYLQS